MYTSMLDSAAGGAFMTKTASEAKATKENMLLKKTLALAAKVDAIYSYISKKNIHNVILLRTILKILMSTLLETMGTMGMVTTIIIPMLGHHMFQTSILVGAMFLMI